MYRKKIISVSLLLLCAGVSLAQNTEKENVVRIESGLVQGFDHEGSLGFLGIPYAKVERFMPPKPVDKWDTVMVCNHWGPMTMQPMGREMSKDEMSEDCCVLNVWTTDRNAKKPVMLWLHGGGFDSGTSEWDPGMKLAQKDVVCVSINHRLNILGFLDLSACSPKYKHSGNVGMMDVVAALKWIRNNIAQFGGDPDNVTVFGESGGGGKVGTLLCMPDAKDLFHKAIILSGTILNVNTKEMSESLGKAVLAELGISNDSIEKIKDVPYKELYAAGQRAMGKSIGTRKPGTPMMWGFGPSPDGEILMQQPFQPGFASFSDSKPILIGTTFNELQRLTYDKPVQSLSVQPSMSFSALHTISLLLLMRLVSNSFLSLEIARMSISRHLMRLGQSIHQMICCQSTVFSVLRQSSRLIIYQPIVLPQHICICSHGSLLCIKALFMDMS